MSEEKTQTLNVESTNPLPIETLFKQFAELMTRRFDQLEAEVRTGDRELVERLTALETEVAGVKLELSGVKGQLDHIEERVVDLDEKVDSFIKETIHIKREMKKLQPLV